MLIPAQDVTIPAQNVDLGYEIVATTLPISGGSINATINAPSGKVVVGAGWSGMAQYYAGANEGIRHFHPTTDGTGWVIDADFTVNGYTPTPTLYLICINA
jgi:hypothetical protein